VTSATLSQDLSSRTGSNPKRARGPFDLDPKIGALIFRIGRYTLHHGALGAVRSLGDLGIPITATAENRLVPVALSRYTTNVVIWPNDGTEPSAYFVEELLRLAKAFDRPPIVIATDDEAAVVLAEYRAILAPHFLLPAVPEGLPRSLADKSELSAIVTSAGVPSARTYTPRTREELAAGAESWTLPLIVKNASPFDRLVRPAVSATTIVNSWAQLNELARAWQEPFGVIIQEYLPAKACEDWIVHGYCASDGSLRTVFTGVKLRSWPPKAGVTTYATVRWNDELARLSQKLMSAVNYRGLFDLDWRFDRRDGQFKLLDFNPRLGAQAAMFVDANGLDVVRALHLDLSGQRIPVSPQREGDRFVAEHLDLPALVAYKGSTANDRPPRLKIRRLRFAFFDVDDPLPFFSAVVCSGLHFGRRLFGTPAPARKRRRSRKERRS
jgi:D-aspartate ligase